jgi:hypothetical protein
MASGGLSVYVGFGDDYDRNWHYLKLIRRVLKEFYFLQFLGFWLSYCKYLFCVQFNFCGRGCNLTQ